MGFTPCFQESGKITGGTDKSEIASASEQPSEQSEQEAPTEEEATPTRKEASSSKGGE